MVLKVYGAISQIFEPGVFTLCTPVFVRHFERGKHTKFYRLNDEGKVVEVDLKKYGTPIFLPAGKKKINDGKEYFIVYRSTQNATKKQFASYTSHGVYLSSYAEANWMAADLSMGIKFPDKFVCVLKPGVDKETLEKMMQ